MKKNMLLIVLLVCSVASYTQQNERKYLSGTGYDDAVKWEFYCTAGNNSGRWTTILVPSCWELQGFGKYNYGHDNNPSEEQGKYRHYFTIPSAWREKAIYLVFEGVMTDAEVWVNEQQAGPIHQGAFYTFKYDITDFVRYGQQNLLEVTVSKRSADPSVNSAERQADYWVFGGIFRPVYLEARPFEHIQRIALDAQADGNVTVDVFFKNISVSTAVVARIQTLEGENMGAPFSKPLKRSQTTERLKTQRHQPYLWTAETPNRFQIEIQLKSGNRTVHEVIKKFGFRTIEVRPGRGIYINGQMVKLKGVNRHSFWPESGRTLSRDINVGDVNLIKNMNMNAVRMSHYPPDEYFLDVCDSLGLYVLNELAGWQTSYDTPVGEKLVQEMVIRDVNHPCVIFWDNGNEGGWNEELDDDFAKHDIQKRTVLHPWELFNGINTTHYQTFEQYKKLAEEGPDILLPTEIWHGLYDGGHAAGLEDYWQVVTSNRLAAGFFLWAFVDEGVKRTDMGGSIDTDGNHAPDGIVGPARQKEGSYDAIKEILSPLDLQMELDVLTPNFNGVIKVANRFDFTDLSECSYNCWLDYYPEFGGGRKNSRTKQVRAICQPIESGATGDFGLRMPADYREYDNLVIQASDPTGRVIYEKGFPTKTPAEVVREYFSPRDGVVNWERKGDLLAVETRNLLVEFSLVNGRLMNVEANGKTVSFKNGPALVSGSTRSASIDFDNDGHFVMNVTYNAGNMKFLEWHVYANGWVTCEYQYDLEGYYDYMGVTFDYPENQVLRKRYLARGPYRVWKNRQQGGSVNVYEKAYNNTITGQSWDYPEFKGYFADLYWCSLTTNEGPIHIFTETDDLYLRLFTPENGPNPRNCRFSMPGGDISFLHGISPIGTKFHTAANTGPSGQKNRAQGSYSAKLYFYFGNLDR